MCRAEAQRVYARKADFDALGVSLCATVKENLPGEIDAFREFWPAPIYMDPTMEFYKISGKKTSLATFLARLLNPFSGLNKNLKQAQVQGNTIGEGFIHGGIYVVRKQAKKGEEAVFAAPEEELGDGPSMDALLAAAKKAVV